MSIQRTAESALHALGELYHVVEASSQQQGQLTMNDSENLVQALGTLSQLINHIHQTDMCAHPAGITSNLPSYRWHGSQMRSFIPPSFSDYDEHMMLGSPSHRGQPYGECIVYHPIRIRTTGAGTSTVLLDGNFDRKERLHRKNFRHHHRKHRHLRFSVGFLHSHHSKKNGKQSSSSDSESSKSVSQATRNGRRRRRRPMSPSRARGLRSDRRSTTSSSSSSSSSSSPTSSSRRSRSPRSRSSRKRNQKSHANRGNDRSHRQNFRRQRSAGWKNKQYHGHKIQSRRKPRSDRRRSPSAAALASTSNARILPSSTFVPAMPLSPSPAVSTLHQSSSQMPTQQKSVPLAASVYGSQVSRQRSIPNPTIDQTVPYQQVQPSAVITAPASLSQQQQQRLPGFLSNHPSPRIPSPAALPTPTTVLTSRSENCPECRAITRLLQWTPSKCYDLAGSKSNQLFQALQSSMNDSSLSLDDIED